MTNFNAWNPSDPSNPYGIAKTPYNSTNTSSALAAYANAGNPDAARATQQLGNGLPQAAQSGQIAQWDNSLDAHVGQIDQQLRDMAGGASANNPDLAQDLHAQRQAANAQRWRSAVLGRSAAGQRVAQLIQSGQLSYDDLGSIDITALNNDQQLGTSLDELLKNKLAQGNPPPTPAAGATAVDNAAGDASKAVSNVLPDVTKYANDIATTAAQTYEKELNTKMGEVSGAATQNANNLGAGFASGQANQSGSNLQANEQAGWDVTKQKVLTDVNSYVDKALSDDVGQQDQLASMSATDRIQHQTQALTGLTDEVNKAVQEGTIKSQAQADQINNAIQAWQTALARGEQGTKERMGVLKLLGGVVAVGAGTALAIGTGGAGSFAGGAIAAGGLSTIAQNS